MQKSSTPLLDTITDIANLRALPAESLPQLAAELRQDMINIVSQTGGHLGAGLGVVELTIALHYIFNTPNDRLIWDIGHQAYPHKILTGRRQQMPTIRQAGGISGFTKRSESVFDPFGAAHSSTSISAGLGMAAASQLKEEERFVISVIGDGALSAGMAYEALNNAGAMKSRLVVILNDNDMSIAPPTGAMSGYLSKLVSSAFYRNLRNKAKGLSKKLPKALHEKAKRWEEYARGFFMGGTLFEELGFYYIGPLDGHNFNQLLPVLHNIHSNNETDPILIHVVTKKGKGYAPAEAAADKYHGVSKFDVDTGEQVKSSSKTYTHVFAESLIEAAKTDDKVVAITAAMPSGTGLDKFAKAFPERCFDVGIAEQHAVTFAGGLACEGLKPVVALYSTFLQRAYDQVVHDISLQQLPVRFAIDRAGLVGADGATHAGSFDIAYLSCLPKFVLMAAADEIELRDMVHTAIAFDEGPIGFRYPRENAKGLIMPEQPRLLEIGKGRILKEGNDIAILSLGTRLESALKAANSLAEMGVSATVADARFAKPLDTDLITRLAKNHKAIITLEEGSDGGFGSLVLTFMARNNLLQKCKIYPKTLPDVYLEQGNTDKLYELAGLDHVAIMETALELLNLKNKQ